MYVFNEESKRPSHMSSQKQDRQGVEFGGEMVIANVENDESTTVHKNIQFEIPPVELGFLAKHIYKVRI